MNFSKLNPSNHLTIITINKLTSFCASLKAASTIDVRFSYKAKITANDEVNVSLSASGRAVVSINSTIHLSLQ